MKKNTHTEYKRGEVIFLSECDIRNCRVSAEYIRRISDCVHEIPRLQSVAYLCIAYEGNNRLARQITVIFPVALDRLRKNAYKVFS